MSGEDVLRALWADPATRRVPMIVMTADATPGLSSALKAAGATACVTKPLDIKHILQLIDDLLTRNPKTHHA
jgi:CheY-like chemotaxis protein